MMLETATVALATFFATIGPLDVAAVFAALTASHSPQRRRQMAFRGAFIATAVLLLFAFTGETILELLGISLAALRTGGGILLLLIGIDMVFQRSSGSTSTTDEEEAEAMGKQDISVFPIATPLIAGPGAMGAAVLLIADTEGDLILQAIIVASLLVILAMTLIFMLLSAQVDRLFGKTGMHVITRIMGVLLAALAVQFIFDGIAASGLIPGS
ncbi:MAG: MarC family protein [Pseudomonadales bacterium]|jgi:multiple antibiotic resistance protein|nr:MarC family protein [Pseudomonadales bacterium]